MGQAELKTMSDDSDEQTVLVQQPRAAAPRKAEPRPEQVKSEQAFKTISEVSAELDVPQHVLRFWESRFGQIKPMKLRGGRRYYRPEDVAVLLRIKTLLYSQGYTIKGAKKVFDEKGQPVIEAKSAFVKPAAAPEQGSEKLADASERLIAKLEHAGDNALKEHKGDLKLVLIDLYKVRDMLRKIA